MKVLEAKERAGRYLREMSPLTNQGSRFIRRSRSWRGHLLLAAQLSVYFLNRLPDISLCYRMWPLVAFSLSVPVESGVRRSFVTHDSMKLTAQPLPAPSRLLLEAEQLLRERFPALVFLHSSRS